MAGKPPSHVAYALKRESRTSWRWLEIGVATKDDDGKGFLLILDRITIGGFNGRVYVRERDLKPEPPSPADIASEDSGSL